MGYGVRMECVAFMEVCGGIGVLGILWAKRGEHVCVCVCVCRWQMCSLCDYHGFGSWE